MRIKCLLLLVLAFMPKPAGAEPTIAGLRGELGKATSDSARVRVYKAIYDHYNPSSSDSARTYVEEGLTKFIQTGYKYGQGAMLMLLSNIYSEQGAMAVARGKAEEALQLFTALKEKAYMGKANNSIGNADSYVGNYTEAVRHFLAAQKLFEDAGDTTGLINTYLELGAANDFNGNHDKALTYYRQALGLSGKETASTVYLYNNIGLYYARKNNYDTALKYFEKAEKIGNGPDLVKARLSPLINIGKLYHEKGDDKQALAYLHAALELARGLKTVERTSRVLLEIGGIETGNNPANTASLQEGLKIAKEMDSKRLQAEFLTALAGAADKRGNYKEEAALLKQATAVRDSIFNIDKAREIANMQSEADLKRTAGQLAELENAEHRDAKKKDIIIVIAVVLAATLLTLLTFYSRSRRLNGALFAREEELKKANAVKDRLFSIIGHDLKGPIGQIPALISIYKSEGVSEVEKEYILQSMEESSMASLDTLEKLLSWGKQLIKGHTYSPSVLNVDDIVSHKLRLLKVAAANKNINIVNKIPPDTSVFADENHFKFIMRNLISNAVKFTYPGGRVEINAERDMNNGHTSFSVMDSGIGMDEEMQQHIFELYNESIAGTANEAGTSIGLLLCKEFVAQNGGDIWVKSEKGKGTTFFFTMRSN